MYMVNRHDRVHISDSSVSTDVSLKKIERKIAKNQRERAAAAGGAYHAALGGHRGKAIGELLVAFYNDEELAPSSVLVVGESIGTLFTEFQGTERLVVALNVLLGSLSSRCEELSDEQMRFVRRDVKKLRSAHRRFRAAVTWLCSTKNPKRAVSPQKLTELLKSGRLYWGRYPDIDRETENFVRYFEDHGLKHFRFYASVQEGRLLLFPRCNHLIDPFCAFLLHQCEGKRPEQMPVKLCPQCRRLFLAQGAKKFCSAPCHDKAFWTPERKADYAYVCRLGDYSKADLQKRLEEQKVQNRLDEIETRWPAWQTINDKVGNIRAVSDRKGRNAERMSRGVVLKTGGF